MHNVVHNAVHNVVHNAVKNVVHNPIQCITLPPTTTNGPCEQCRQVQGTDCSVQSGKVLQCSAYYAGSCKAVQQCTVQSNLGKKAESALLLMRPLTRGEGVAPFRGLIRKENHEDCDDD